MGQGNLTKSEQESLGVVAGVLEREGLFRQWVETAHAGFWAIDADAKTTFVNERLAHMLGYEREEMLGMPLSAFMDERGREIAELNIRRRQEGIEEQHDFEFVRKDGARVITSMETSPYTDAEGNYAGAVAFVSDVTALREADQRARYLAAVVEAAEEGVISLAPDGTIRSWNPAAQRIFGYTPEEVIGQHVTILSPEGTRATSQELFVRSKAGNPPVRLDVKRRHKDGHEVHVSLSLSVRRDEFGEISSLVGVIRDVGDRVEAERKLLSSNRLLSSLLECAGEGVFVKDADLKFRFANERATAPLGIEPDAIVGKTDADFLPQPLADESREQDLEVIRTRRTITREFRMTSPDGDDVWLVETKAPLLEHGAKGDVTGVVGVSRDITAMHVAQERQRALETQMLHAQKLESLGLLAGGIAHDFNNLLVSILGYADLASMELATSSPVQADLTAIIEASRQASDLCRQLLAYAGRGRFVIEQVELSDTLSDVVALLEVTVSKPVSLQLDLANTSIIVEADVTQLRQVFMNLVTNASEAVGSMTGVIRVSTGTTVVDADYFAGCVTKPNLEAGTYAFFEVADSGSGMDVETARKIFDPFFTTKTMGRGLGLAAVLGIIRGHGGAIRVYSEPDRGTSVKVLLPLVNDAQRPAKSKVPREVPDAGVILVVDDESGVLQFVRRALTRAGFEVMTASSGEDAVARFSAESDRVSAVLLDVTMPGMDGHQTFSELRRIRATVPVVLSSGFSEQDMTGRLSDSGLAGFLPKPYSVHELLSCLRRAMGSPAPG